MKLKTNATKGRPANDPGFPWVGLALRVRRIAQRLSATDVANALGVSRSAVHSWESDAYQPSATHVAALADLLGCKPRYFSKSPSLPKR